MAGAAVGVAFQTRCAEVRAILVVGRPIFTAVELRLVVTSRLFAAKRIVTESSALKSR